MRGSYDDLAWFVLGLLLMFVCMAGLGYALGYVVGTVSAGVFLVVDRKWDAGKRGDASSGDVEAEQATTASASAVPATGRWWLEWIVWSPLQWFWQGRNRPVRNAIALTFLAAVLFAIGIPIAQKAGFLKAYLIGIPIASPLVGLALSGVLLARRRVPLIFCALGIAGMVYPVDQIKMMFVTSCLRDPDISFPDLTVYTGVALGLIVAGFYGWVRWMLPERAKPRGGWRLGLLFGAGFAVALVFLGAGARYTSNSPRERVLWDIFSGGGSIDGPSPFTVHYLSGDSGDLG